ncbi:MAG: metallophosphoesterase [Bacteroidia bacterium]|jgi:serine/threonine protein phosphatase 1|nr:metallophosphoesterase [Bacteroidia bacterium]
MKTYVLGDIHGAHRAMKQVLRQVNFNYNEDRLIQIGDIVDGWPDAVDCVEELMKIKNLIAIRGNHDCWLYDWLETGRYDSYWPEFGGTATMKDYIRKDKDNDKRHLRFFENQRDYFVDEQNRLFVHAGYSLHEPLAVQPSWVFYGSRDYFSLMLRCLRNDTGAPKDVNGFHEVFIGHTQTPKYTGHDKPLNVFNMWNVDQGCKSEGRLTLMNVDTKEYVQSDLVFTLYPEFA